MFKSNKSTERRALVLNRAKTLLTSTAVMIMTVVVAVLVAPTAAQAATYNGVCGSGYGVIDSASITGGTVFLTYNSSTHKNCVVTIRNSPGSAIWMNALVSRAGQPWIDDPGYWTTYAGPVYVYAPGTCIDWGGEIGSAYFYEFGTHCS